MATKQEELIQVFDKCTNYSVLMMVVVNTINSMRRFSNIPKETVLIKAYKSIKERAEATAA